MGIGDEIMVTALVRKMQRTSPLPVAIKHQSRQFRYHAIWENNPRIVNPRHLPVGTAFQTLDVHGGARPYIDYEKSPADRSRWVFKPTELEPGEIYFNAQEKLLIPNGYKHVIVEPNIKAGAPVNKQWHFARWQELCSILREMGYQPLQLGNATDRRLVGIKHCFTPSVREAAAIIAGALGVITHEGAFHHIAACFGVPTVVIRGGYIGPQVTGYPGQWDFFTPTLEHPIGCGNRMPCAHCRATMDRIEASQVAEAMQKLLTPG